MVVGSHGTSRKRMGRPPVKQDRIVADLRRRIISGAVAPSGRLVTRKDLCRQYDASSVTVQQAIDQLVAEGFVVSRGALGTFVSDNPPHLNRYVIVVSRTPEEADYSMFWTAIENESQRLHRTAGLDVTVFHGVQPRADSKSFQQVVADVQRHRLAGLIFLHSPFEYRNTPLLDEPGIPRAAFMLPVTEFPNVTAVFTNYEDLFQRGLDYLASRGRRRVAIIARAFLPPGWPAWIENAVTQRGMFMEPYWFQFPSEGSQFAARNCAHLLMNTNQSVRPDALIIADDNLVPAVSSGLVRAGIRVPEDLDIVAHCNFPWPASSVLPMKRLGFDARAVLRACIDSIDAQRRGEGVKSPVTIGAVFEDEVQS